MCAPVCKMLKSELRKFGNQSLSLVGLEQLRARMEDKLASSDIADRRFVLEALSTRIIVTTEGTIEVEFAISNDAPNSAIALDIPWCIHSRTASIRKALQSRG